jgi:hypothetical protein
MKNNNTRPYSFRTIMIYIALFVAVFPDAPQAKEKTQSDCGDDTAIQQQSKVDSELIGLDTNSTQVVLPSDFRILRPKHSLINGSSKPDFCIKYSVYDGAKLIGTMPACYKYKNGIDEMGEGFGIGFAGSSKRTHASIRSFTSFLSRHDSTQLIRNKFTIASGNPDFKLILLIKSSPSRNDYFTHMPESYRIEIKQFICKKESKVCKDINLQD